MAGSMWLRWAALALFAVAAVFVQKNDPALRVPALLAFLLSTPALLALARAPGVEAPRLARGLSAGIALLLLVQLVYFALRVRHPHLPDIAETTRQAGTVLLGGINPYAAPLDAEAIALMGPAFGGYKYLPVMIAAYLPLGSLLGDRGMLATNLLLQIGVAALVLRLGARLGDGLGARLAALLYLALPIAIMQVLSKGSTDILAVLLLLLAFLAFEKRPGLAGVWVGLSIATKLVPGALFLACLLPADSRARRRYVLGGLLGLLPILPFVLWSPEALVDNILLFNLARPPDATSWLAAAPAGIATALRGALLASYLGIVAWLSLKPAALATRGALGIALSITAILASPTAHHNYQLWWLPFYCVLLAAAVARAPQREKAGS